MPVNDVMPITDTSPNKPLRASKKVGVLSGTPKPQKRMGKAANGNGKAVKVSRAISRNPDKLDVYGLRKGTKKSLAVALYAAKRGATINEVTEKLGSRQFNVIQELEARGFKFERTQEGGAGKRPVTRFKLIDPSKLRATR